MLQYIDISKISPHPDNPRKDLGDLTELAESIKANGILQNLTVVPWFSSITYAPADDDTMDGYYVAVIGHRRLAAAKLAGLEEVPCIVSDMSLREQVATMLLENMQRNDLTVYEQAQGFQMMLNFGDSVNDIAGRTGFSENTVRRRVKLLDLDPDKFKASVERGGTLFDFAELDKIKDPELKNKVLESIGTPNFHNNLQRAIDQEKKEVWFAGTIDLLKIFATEVKDSPQGCRFVKSCSYYREEEFEIPADAGEVKYFYVVSEYGYITLYAEQKQTDKDTADAAAAKEKESERKARYKALEEITKRAYGLRRDFIRNISNAKAKKGMGTIAEHLILCLTGSYVRINNDDLADLLGITLAEGNNLEFDDFSEDLRKQPEKYTLFVAYCLLDGEERRSYYDRNGAHQENKYIDQAYDFLESIGYQISDEEQALRDGTHELFTAGSEAE